MFFPIYHKAWSFKRTKNYLSLYTQRQWKVTSIEISIFWKIYNTALWLLLRSCFWSTANWFGEIKQFHEPWNYDARDVRAFYVFSSFKEFEIIIFKRQRARTCPRHFHWKHHQNGLGYPIKQKRWRSNFKVAPKLCIFLYQSGTGRKTFQAKSMPFWKEKPSNLTFHYGWIFLPISFFTENWKVLPSILMTNFGWKTLPKHPFHCKFGIRTGRVNDVISMLSLHNHAEKSCF